MRISSGLRAHLVGATAIASILCVQLASGQTPNPERIKYDARNSRVLSSGSRTT